MSYLDFLWDRLSRISQTGELELHYSFNLLPEELLNKVASKLEETDNLQIVNFSGSIFFYTPGSIIFNSLRFHQRLRFLDISSCSLNDSLAIEISNLIRKSGSLEYINLSNNGFTSLGMRYLSPALLENTSLLTVELSRNYLGDEGAIELAKVFRLNQTLAYLRIARCEIGDLGVKSFLDALQINTSLKFLDLESNMFTFSSTNVISEFLSRNGGIINIRLGKISLAESIDSSSMQLYMEKISQALILNASLRCLALVDSSIRDVGANSLAKAIQLNSRLQRLVISGNNIGHNGATSIARMISNSKRLNFLDLHDNPIGFVANQEFMLALSRSPSLLVIQCD